MSGFAPQPDLPGCMNEEDRKIIIKSLIDAYIKKNQVEEKVEMAAENIPENSENKKCG